MAVDQVADLTAVLREKYERIEAQHCGGLPRMPAGRGRMLR